MLFVQGLAVGILLGGFVGSMGMALFVSARYDDDMDRMVEAAEKEKKHGRSTN